MVCELYQLIFNYLKICPLHFPKLLYFPYFLPWFIAQPASSIPCQKLGIHPRLPSASFHHPSISKTDHVPPEALSYTSTCFPRHCPSWVQAVITFPLVHRMLPHQASRSILTSCFSLLSTGAKSIFPNYQTDDITPLFKVLLPFPICSIKSLCLV